MRTSIQAAFAFIVVVLWIDSAHPSEGVDQDRLSKISLRMQQLVADGRMAGAVFLLAKDGELLLHEAVGYHDIDSQTPMSKDALFAVASMTKPVTTVAAMILIDEGRLGLDDLVASYLQGFQDGASIRVRHLMSHTSGLPYGRSKQARSIKRLSLADVVKPIGIVALEYPPGEGEQYSNLGMQTLGRVVEVVSGQRFEDFVSDRILRPLKMEDSFFFVSSELKSRVPTLYEELNGLLQRSAIDLTTSRYNFVNPAGGLFSTANDMFRFHQMMLNGGALEGTRILSRAAVQTMITPRVEYHNGPVAPGTGLGWWVVPDSMAVVGLPMQPRGSFGHSGFWGTLGWVNPTDGVVGVFLVHKSNDQGAVLAHRFVAMAAAAIE